MGQINNYSSLLKEILRQYEHLYNLHPRPGIETVSVFDDEHKHYFLMQLGWEEQERVKRTVVHVRLRDNKFWIEEDWTEEGIATDLMRAGVPNTDIVLAFQPPNLRPYTEFAVA